jgi:hypothetical protein
MLDKLEGVAEHLPQVVNVGADGDQSTDFMELGRRMLGAHNATLYTAEDMQLIRERTEQIAARIRERAEQISKIVPDGHETQVEVQEPILQQHAEDIGEE